MNRRDFLAGGLFATAMPFNTAPFTAIAVAAGELGWPSTLQADDGLPFSHAWLIEVARLRAATPFKALEKDMPAPLADLTYDQYRDIRFRGDRGIWAGEGRGFTCDLFHPGFYYKIPVATFVVRDGKAAPIFFSPDLFDYGPNVPPVPADPMLGFSGFRVRRPINRPDVWDEFLVFQGASYFRAVAPGQQYGLSARGLAIDTAAAEGEEFPAFTHVFLETPEPDAAILVVHALLESERATGAYRFTIRPGAETIIDVEATLFAREAMRNVGIAPLTSMFMFDTTNRNRFDDFRNAVHDSDGLLMFNGAGERLWRPLANPERLQVSAFVDNNPQGFGLIQRRSAFGDFQDLEARYDLRPSLWIEPVGGWGDGEVVLVEIPTNKEIHDNIVAYWRPAAPLKPGEAQTMTYRMRWGHGPAMDDGAIVAASRIGLNFNQDRRIAVIDFTGGHIPTDATIELTHSAGSVSQKNLQPNPVAGGMRASFEFDPAGAELIEFRLRLVAGERVLSETWIYRWTA